MRGHVMTNLILRDNLFEDLFDVRREFDKIFNRMLTVKPNGKEKMGSFESFDFAPAIESFVDKTTKKYVCKIALPGIESKDVQIHVQGNMLTISGERNLSHETKDLDYLYQEFTYGKFEREFELPEGVIADKLNAAFINGLLEITAPIAEVALPKKIEIKTVPFVKQVAA
jgi:HSP20 family protein